MDDLITINKRKYGMFRRMHLENNKYIEDFAYLCGDKLLNQRKIKEFTYPNTINSLDRWDDDYVDMLISIQSNEQILKSVSGKFGVYALFEKNKSKVWDVKYIGHTNAKYARQRIRNHLIKKDVRTGAQLSSIQNSVLIGNKIGISFLEIHPGYLRHVVEELLIHKYSERLAWNERGKAKA
jgi:hypothetical protein